MATSKRRHWARLLSGAALALAAPLALAQVSIDANSSASKTGSGTLTWTHTVGSAANGVLLVGVVSDGTTTQPSSVSWNGSALTKIGSVQNATFGDSDKNALLTVWYLTAPATGTHSISVTQSAGSSFVAGATSFTNVSQSTPYSGFTTGKGTSNPTTLSQPAGSGLFVDFIGVYGGGGTTLTPSQTLGWKQATGNQDRDSLGGSSTKTTAGTTAWTLSTSESWAAAGLWLNAAGSGGGGSSSAAGFNVVDGYFASYPASAAGQRIYTKLASSAFTLNVAALNSTAPTPGLLSPAYVSGTNKVTVDLVDDSDGSCASSCSGAACTAKTAVARQSTSFASGNNSYLSGLSFTVANAYPNLRVRVTDTSSSPAVVGCSVDNFSVRPTDLAIASSAAADATGSSATATPVVGAGSSFTLTATAIAGYNGTPAVSSASITANPSNAGTLAGSFGAANASTGAASGSFSYSEVGYFRLNADAVSDGTFTAVDQAAGDCTADYSNSPVNGKVGCYFGNAAASAYVGRFVPDHFALSPGSVTPACGTFTYYDQDGFTTSFTLTAQNAANATTRNYAGSFARLALTAWSSYAFTGDAATPSASATPPSGTWSNGMASVSARYQVPARPTSTPAAPVSLTVSAQPADADGVTTAAPVAVMSAPTAIRFGVLAVGSAAGSNLQTVRVPVTAMYWNGQGMVANTADSCTGSALSNASVALGNQVQKPGASGTLSTSVASSPSIASTWSRGAGWITLTPAGSAGAAQVALNLGSTSPDDSCVNWSVPSSGAALPWLRGRWCGTDYSIDPSSLVSFGAAASPYVLVREMF